MESSGKDVYLHSARIILDYRPGNGTVGLGSEQAASHKRLEHGLANSRNPSIVVSISPFQHHYPSLQPSTNRNPPHLLRPRLTQPRALPLPAAGLTTPPPPPLSHALANQRLPLLPSLLQLNAWLVASLGAHQRHASERAARGADAGLGERGGGAAVVALGLLVGRQGGGFGRGEVGVAVGRELGAEAGRVGGEEGGLAVGGGVEVVAVVAVGVGGEGFGAVGPVGFVVVADLVDVPALAAGGLGVGDVGVALGGLLREEVFAAVFVAHDGLDAAGHVDGVVGGGARDEGVEGVARVEWDVWGVGVAGQHVGEGEA